MGTKISKTPHDEIRLESSLFEVRASPKHAASPFSLPGTSASTRSSPCHASRLELNFDSGYEMSPQGDSSNPTRATHSIQNHSRSAESRRKCCEIESEKISHMKSLTSFPLHCRSPAQGSQTSLQVICSCPTKHLRFHGCRKSR